MTVNHDKHVGHGRRIGSPQPSRNGSGNGSQGLWGAGPGGVSQERMELFHRQIRLAHDAAEHEWRQNLSRMQRHRYPLPLGTDQKVVATIDAI